MTVEIYTLPYCPYCKRAKDFFDSKNIKYKEYPLDENEEEKFRELQEKFDIQGEVTAPQIIINGKRIGGYSDLIEKVGLGEIKF